MIITGKRLPMQAITSLKFPPCIRIRKRRSAIKTIAVFAVFSKIYLVRKYMKKISKLPPFKNRRAIIANTPPTEIRDMALAMKI